MEYYRLYLYDAEGHIERAVELDCRSDAHALSVLQEHAPRHPVMELWNRTRLIASHGTNPIDARLAH